MLASSCSPGLLIISDLYTMAYMCTKEESLTNQTFLIRCKVHQAWSKLENALKGHNINTLARHKAKNRCKR